MYRAYSLSFSLTILLLCMFSCIPQLTFSKKISTTSSVTELDAERFLNMLQSQKTTDTPFDALILFYDSFTLPTDNETLSSSSSSSTSSSSSSSVLSMTTSKCKKNSLQYLLTVYDNIARHLQTTTDAIQLATYDTAIHGIPNNLYLHGHHDPVWLVLFPTPYANRESLVHYEWIDDQSSYSTDINGENACSNKPNNEPTVPIPHEQKQAHIHADGETCTHDHSNDDHHHHHHHDHHHHDHHHEDEHTIVPRLTQYGILRWLKSVTSFPNELPSTPEVTLAKKYKGRTDELWTAVLRGLEALHEQMKTLEEENTQLREELKLCSTKNQKKGGKL